MFALDPVFLQSLIGATGSVKLSDGKVLDGTNTVKFSFNELYVDHPIYKELERLHQLRHRRRS